MTSIANDLTYQKITPESWLSILSERKGQEKRVARGIQEVLRTSYSRVFEGAHSVYGLPNGTIKSHFQKTPDHIRARIDRTTAHLLHYRAIYWLAWGDDELIGLAKTMPSKKLKPGSLALANCYLNDIAVVEEGQGIGATLMKKALGDYAGDKKVVLDAYNGNDRANDWFARLGFKVNSEQPPNHYFQIGEILVPQVRMTAERNWDVRATLTESITQRTYLS